MSTDAMLVPPAVTTVLPAPNPSDSLPEMPHAAKLTTSSKRSVLATQVPAAFRKTSSMVPVRFGVAVASLSSTAIAPFAATVDCFVAGFC